MNLDFLGKFKGKGSRAGKEKVSSPEKFLKHLKANPLNAWIFEDRNILRSFEELFSNFNPEHFVFFGEGDNIVFLKSNGNYGCAIGAQNFDHIVVIFPNLYRLLLSGAPRIGQAILAHEIGHLYFRHAQREISALEAQIEADSFASELNYGKELENILLEQSGLEIQTRLAYLTSLWAQKEIEKF